MKYKTLLLLPALLCSLFLFAQGKRYMYYYDDQLNNCAKRNAVFTGYGMEENNLFKLMIFSNDTKKPLLIQYYTDSSLTTNQGPYQIYFANGTRKEQGTYENNKPNGDWEKWDSTGQMTDSLNYDMGVINDSTKFYYDGSGGLGGMRFTDIKNDILKILYYNATGKETEEIRFIGNKGLRTTYTKDGVHKDSLYTREEKEATFPGGHAAWVRYITGALNKRMDIGNAGEAGGKCLIRFVVERDGSVSGVEALTVIDSKLAKVAIDVISNSPKWTPAIQFGKVVRALRLQPVTY